ncbi:hypothetical protein SAY87_007144 [Trapa incisa]|uniref:Fibronectin type-III domain-containing protein n=1 Tax=Trapa incisa TaxID=236973 RepID=A0AAN7K0R5_9MYRT|nr:hypothetical protein SAY87_007144 [Trapa incisa]
MKYSASSKTIMREASKPSNNKIFKRLESRKASYNTPNEPSTKKARKQINPIRIPLALKETPDHRCPKSLICENSACNAILSSDDEFCRRCSCCICHTFDDNRDSSLWLVCSSEDSDEDTCGFSCHIECALQQKKVGVVDLGQSMAIDGSYLCVSCGKASGILRLLRKQLAIAKDARRLDILCYRIYLSYRILNGTLRFKELHEIITDMKAKLETEVGAINGVSVKIVSGTVSTLSVASDVQKLCSLGVEKAEELLAKSTENTAPAECKILFDDVGASSITIVLLDSSSSSSSHHDIKGYKLWYCKSGEETYGKEPILVFPRERKRISISNLLPCTEYMFRLISFSETADLGHLEAKCFTRSLDIIHRCSESTYTLDGTNDQAKFKYANNTVGSSRFTDFDSEKILQAASGKSQGGNSEGFCSADTEKCCTMTTLSYGPTTAGKDQALSVLHEIDLNVTSVPDLNEEATPVSENSGEAEYVTGIDNTIGCLQKGGNPRDEICRKRAMTKEEAHDSDSTLMNGSNSPSHSSNGWGCLDQNFEYCVKTIRRLECRGLISEEFRLKFLTWFSLKSTEQERRVVCTFVQTMADDPSSLAGQLVDSFSEIMSIKRQRTRFCSSKD